MVLEVLLLGGTTMGEAGCTVPHTRKCTTHTHKHTQQSNVVLEVLLLGGNPVGEAGARHLMAALGGSEGVNLQFLGLAGSNMTGVWAGFTLCIAPLASL